MGNPANARKNFNRTYLCVGGPLDGQKIEMHWRMQRFDAPLDEGPVVTPLGSAFEEPRGVSYITYKLVDVFVNEVKFNVMAPSSWNPTVVMDRLLSGYKPEVK